MLAVQFKLIDELLDGRFLPFQHECHIQDIVPVLEHIPQEQIVLNGPDTALLTGIITIKQQLQCKDGEYFLETPKSGRGRSILPAPVVMEALKKEQEKQKAAKAFAGACWSNPMNLVFTDAIGKHLVWRTVVKHFKKVAERAGVEESRFHDLRHTFAVTSLYAGDDIKSVQANLGHATAQFTLDVYGHVTQTMRKESAERMQRFYDQLYK